MTQAITFTSPYKEVKKNSRHGNRNIKIISKVKQSLKNETFMYSKVVLWVLLCCVGLLTRDYTIFNHLEKRPLWINK